MSGMGKNTRFQSLHLGLSLEDQGPTTTRFNLGTRFSTKVSAGTDFTARSEVGRDGATRDEIEPAFVLSFPHLQTAVGKNVESKDGHQCR